ncbi:11957_t:CDS:10 [Diversispora eburnea]|uniref:11957_t:CDS:1 n=1 Tax=Diversispora eburnea TaxID=1213867 RepID=A0A9N8YY58_9GLOM|nr:11957_t:CDS:10 [Diversispora eburnea]
MSNKQILFVKRPPSGALDVNETFKIIKSPIPKENDLKNGQILVKNYYLSLDPAMRSWMSEARSYIPPIAINDVMRSMTIGEVIFSKNPKFKIHDKVSGLLVSDGKGVEKIDFLPGTSLIDYISTLGVTGKPKPGETVVVSGAAGAVGSIAGQIAKIKETKVIGIAGSKEKCDWLLNELGFDVALNYKDPDFDQKFKAATPKYIDIYFDNVGGKILNLSLSRLALKGRIVLSGGISQYNEKEVKGPSNYLNLIPTRGKMESFIVMDYYTRFREARKDLSKWLQEGKIKKNEHIVNGLENAPEGLVKLFQGVNIGKMVVKVNEENNFESKL